jgi:hypothetical protein
MTKQQLRETVRNIIRQTLAENQPATAPSKPKTEPAVAPGKPAEKKPRRPLGNPEVKPKPKATMTEADMLARIIKRFKSIKSTNEGIDNIAMGEKPFSNFSEADQLLKSISDRLITASQMQDWNLVDEVAIDVFNFVKNR